MVLALRQTLTGYGTAVRLGWAVSSNWAHPVPFIIYTILRPISGALILVVMYTVITGGRADGNQFAALFGSFSIGALGYLAVLVQVALIAGVTALTSRRTVNHTIETIH